MTFKRLQIVWYIDYQTKSIKRIKLTKGSYYDDGYRNWISREVTTNKEVWANERFMFNSFSKAQQYLLSNMFDMFNNVQNNLNNYITIFKSSMGKEC
jgi:hypothetical protein